jgi:hypothetical protein
MGYLHSVSLWYNYIFSLANNSSFALLPMQHSYAKNIANSRKEHNIVGPDCNLHYLRIRSRKNKYLVRVVECSSRPVWKCTENCAPIGIRSPDHPAPRESLYRLRYPNRHSYIYFKIVYSLCSHKTPNSYYSTLIAVKLVVDQSSRQRRTSLHSFLGHHDSVPSRVLVFGGA